MHIGLCISCICRAAPSRAVRPIVCMARPAPKARMPARVSCYVGKACSAYTGSNATPPHANAAAVATSGAQESAALIIPSYPTHQAHGSGGSSSGGKYICAKNISGHIAGVRHCVWPGILFNCGMATVCITAIIGGTDLAGCAPRDPCAAGMLPAAERGDDCGMRLFCLYRPVGAELLPPTLRAVGRV